jgi:hypothetical protein
MLKEAQNFAQKFSQGRSKVTDDARPGRHVKIVTEVTVQRVEELIRADRRIALDSVTTALGCSHDLAYSIMYDRLKFRELCARWVSIDLKDRGKIKRMGLSLQHLLRYVHEEEHTSMFNMTDTEEES